MQHKLDHSLITEQPLITPEVLVQHAPATPQVIHHIHQARHVTRHIIHGRDPRLLVVVGPCSIHDSQAALEYATLLHQASLRFRDELHLVMRTYFEKPRTIIGWKGLISDPRLDGSDDINTGLTLARKILLDINTLGLPTATEFLDTMVPQYLADLISWTAVGARTSESQLHRELASGLPMPVGFKNSTDGNVRIAMDAVNAARYGHQYLSISAKGVASIMSTEGNHDCHIILRGSHAHSNYGAAQVKDAVDQLKEANLIPRLMIDCSHGNSQKDYRQQRFVVEEVVNQLKQNTTAICGVMLESHLVEGKQPLERNGELVYGQSVTDGCLSWKETEVLLEKLARAVVRR